MLVELIAYVFLLKEYSGAPPAAYAACANIASYAVGYLPLHWAVGISGPEKICFTRRQIRYNTTCRVGNYPAYRLFY